jgi:hypothetical protein
MKLYLREPLKRIFTRKRIVVLAVTKAVVSLIGLAAWRVHEVSELLAAELLFALVFVVLLGIAGSLYLVGLAAKSIERYVARTSGTSPNDMPLGHSRSIPTLLRIG